ncbi:MAG: DUF4350 domain-containing protein [Deltaproteobacteria bacterium]|nr:MAG: DUF4350 domain-containing protein [Deltaproteobacteria bacterium]
MRLAPTLVLVIFAAAALLWLSRDPAIHREGFPAGSSFGTGPEGTSLARAWLEATGSKVSTLSRPLDPAQLPAGAALLRLDAPPYRDGASPLAKDAPALTAQEEDLVRRGARLVLAIRGDESSGPSRKVSPLLPGVVTLKLAKPRRLRASALVDAQPVFEHGEAPSVARRPLGAGEVWFLSEPELFFNENLSQADNLVLLQELAGGGRPVVFDELLHGAGTDTGVLGLLRGWGLGPALLLAALGACAVAWRHAVTVGSPSDPWRDPRGESVELVDSMAALYQRSLSPGEALRLYRGHLVHEISLRLLVGEKRAEALFREYVPDDDGDSGRLSDSEFRARLGRLVSAWERFRDEHRLGRT